MVKNNFFILRIGSNAEKHYIYKSAPFFDAVLARANFFESSTGLLSSLFIKLNVLKKDSSYIIDPCTYVYALQPSHDSSIRSWVKCKRDDAEEKVRKNFLLDEMDNPNIYIREIENPEEKDLNKVEINTIKRAYRKLADTYFDGILLSKIGKEPIVPDDFSEIGILRNFIRKVIKYQKNALGDLYDKRKFKDLGIGIIPPKILLSPYFAVLDDSWFKLMLKIWAEFEMQYKEENAGIILLVSKNYFIKNHEKIASKITKLSLKYVLIWIDGYKDEEASIDELENFAEFTITLSNSGKKLIDLYSGGFKTYLIPFGLSGVTNGAGYGMNREIEPVQGGSVTAQYYIPSLHTRQQVLESFQLLIENKIELSKESFHENICNCPICKEGIIKDASDMLQYFGELGDVKINKIGNKRRYPTRESLERCNFHFILSRLIEYKWAKEANKEDVLTKLQKEISIWKRSNQHLKNWYSILKSKS